MQPGQTLKRGKHEIMLFPGTTWSIAQYWGPGTFSHCCGYPLDYTGGKLYAPCTVQNMGVIDGTSNCELWVSVEPVIVPLDDKPHMIAFQTGHCNTVRGAGTIVPQGQYMTDMGTTMNGSSSGCGLHSHIEFCILPDGVTSTTWAPKQPPCSGGTYSSGSEDAGSAAGEVIKKNKTGAPIGQQSFGQAAVSAWCYTLNNATEYYNVCYMNDTPGDTGSKYASYHKYAKGLSWFVPKEQRNLALNDDEVFNNMRCVYGFFKCLDQIEDLNPLWKSKTAKWTDGAIAGMIGNMQDESGMNPNRWEGGEVGNTSRGYGLVQWTPATEILLPLKNMDPVYNGGYSNLWDEAMNEDPSVLGNAECIQIFSEYCQGTQWGTSAMGFLNASNDSWEEWATSEKFNSREGAGQAALVFQANYERPAILHPERAQNAMTVWDFITTQHWDEEMPSGKAKMEIINPWDMATPVENVYFKPQKDFIPVYRCPYYASGKKSDPITFEFDHFMFPGESQIYERYWFGVGGYEFDKPEDAIATTWFAWSSLNPRDKFHYFAPGYSSVGTYPVVLLQSFNISGNKIDIDKERFIDVFDTEVENPYEKKKYFQAENLNIIYDLLPIGDYDSKSAKIIQEEKDEKADNRIKVQIFFTKETAREKADEILTITDFLLGEMAHFCVDSEKIIQTLSLDRQIYRYRNYFNLCLGIFFTAKQGNPDTSLLEDLLAELYIQNCFDGDLETSVTIINDSKVIFNQEKFFNNTQIKINKRKQEIFEQNQANLLAKIKSQQLFDLLLNQIDNDLKELKEMEGETNGL